jgi:hypothetical protein
MLDNFGVKEENWRDRGGQNNVFHRSAPMPFCVS